MKDLSVMIDNVKFNYRAGLLIEKGDIPCVRACRLSFLLDDAEIHLGGILSSLLSPARAT